MHEPQSAPLRHHAQKKSLHAAEQRRADVAAAREAWREWQPTADAGRLVFIDETWASTAMTRRLARSRRGQRALGAAPHGHWKTTTFVAGLAADGVRAPFVIDRAMNADIFRAYVEKVLAPELLPGDIVVMESYAGKWVMTV